jgi:glycosyltransferase involved in cell wall biosynthesis
VGGRGLSVSEETLISLVIPMYNAERHVLACLDSVARQTYPGFECLCVDDGSTDGTAGIVGDYAARDARFKLHRQVNAGCSAARNAGLRLASAPYLAFLDADDLLHPQAFEILLRLLEAQAADAASFRYRSVPETFVLSDTERVAVEAVSATVDAAPFLSYFSKKHKRESAAAWTRIYRRRAIEGITFPEGVHFAEDLVFVAKVMHRIRTIAVTPLTLLFYRDHPASATKLPLTERQLSSYAQAAQALHAYFAKQSLTPREAAMVSAFLSTLVYKTCVVPFLRDERLCGDAVFLRRAREQWLALLASGAVGLPSLSARKRLAGWCFAKNRLALGRRLDSLVARRGH